MMLIEYVQAIRKGLLTWNSMVQDREMTNMAGLSQLDRFLLLIINLRAVSLR